MAVEKDNRLVSAVLIPMPLEVAAFVNDFHERHAGNDLAAIPAHITLMWPFVSPGTIDGGADPAVVEATLKKLRETCRQIQPFTITLDHYDTFPTVLYLAPQDPTSIIALHKTLFAAFPEFPPYEGEFDQFVPHMTLAIAKNAEALATIPRPPFSPFSFLVDQICFVYGDLEVVDHWQNAVVYPIPLGEDSHE